MADLRIFQSILGFTLFMQHAQLDQDCIKAISDDAGSLSLRVRCRNMVVGGVYAAGCLGQPNMSRCIIGRLDLVANVKSQDWVFIVIAHEFSRGSALSWLVGCDKILWKHNSYWVGM